MFDVQKQSAINMQLIDTLYIEDDEQEALVMEVGMQRFGINILHIPYITAERLHELHAPPYDRAVAVLFDEMLAGESGLKLAQALRSSGDTRLIVLLTAGQNPAPDTLEAQNILFRRKPANFEELAQAIRRAQGG